MSIVFVAEGESSLNLPLELLAALQQRAEVLSFVYSAGKVWCTCYGINASRCTKPFMQNSEQKEGSKELCPRLGV